jgi:streptogramin lyase
MTTTEDGDLWVWFSEFPSTGSLSGRALAYYDSKAEQWTIHESNIPDSVRAMTAINESVWLATFLEDAAIWRFDGQTWTRVHDASGSEVLDVVAAPDGTVWYVADNDLQQVEP